MKKVTLFFLAFLLSSLVSASEKNMMVRLRGITVNPDESGTPTIIGGSVALSNESVPEVDFSYFFTENLALELILATASHEAGVEGNTNNTSSIDLGTVSLLPPTLTFQYHFNAEKFKPYVGAGINYTHFYGVNNGAVKSVEYDDTFGYALQVGTDYLIGDNLYLNFDVKKAFISTDVTVTTYTNTTVTADVDINPWIVGLGIGTRF